MSNQPTAPTCRILIFELWDNGKIICPGYAPIPPEQTITLVELQHIKLHIELMIANPQNFHIIREEFELKKIIIGQSHSNCKQCDVDLLIKTMTERENGLCFDCEKELILAAVNSSNSSKGNNVIRGFNGTHEAYICQDCGLNFANASHAIAHVCDGKEIALCKALGCPAKREEASAFCMDHCTYVGKLKKDANQDN